MEIKNTKVMIVDDSAFSRTLLADMLKENGFDVVGEADSKDCALKAYIDFKPDIVTMDIAMPGADGFECSRAILSIDPNAKIILVSSMKDEETEAEARRIGVLGYVQKPVNAGEFMNTINNILSPNALFNQLKDTGLETFKEVLSQNITSMTKSPVSFTGEQCSENGCVSQGITTVIGIIGLYTGTMILDLSLECAEKIAASILRREPKDKDEVLAMSAELSNIIAGIACSMLNKKNKLYRFRVSPPSIFYGEQAQISSPTISIEGCHSETNFGKISIWVGFKKGNV